MSKEASAKEQQLMELKKLQRRTEQEHAEQKETVEQLKQQIAALQAQKQTSATLQDKVATYERDIAQRDKQLVDLKTELVEA
jgi:hypothetical protein